MDGAHILSRHRIGQDAHGSHPVGCTVLWAVIVICGVIAPASAEETAIAGFDIRDVVACRPIMPEDERPTDTDFRQVEARLTISVLVRPGFEDQIGQLLFVCESAQRTMRIVQYAPATELVTDVVGVVQVQQQAEQASGLSLEAGAEDSRIVSITTGVNATQNSKRNAARNYQQQPPLQLLTASGTVARGHGVYFKFQSSPQSTLEGTKEITLVLEVPAGWRGDWLDVRCVAYGPSTGNSGKLPAIRGCGSFLVALYGEGDSQARAAAEELAACERRLRRVAAQHGIHQRAPAAWWEWLPLSAWWRADDAKLPAGWLDRVIAAANTDARTSEDQRLCGELKAAVAAFQEAKRQLRQWSTGIENQMVLWPETTRPSAED